MTENSAITTVGERLPSPALRADGLSVDFPTKPPLHPDTLSSHPLVRLVAVIGIAAVAFLLCYFATAPLPRDVLVRFGAPITAFALIVPPVVAYWVVGRFMEGRRLAELAWSRIGTLGAGLLLGTALISTVVLVVALLGGRTFHGFQTPADWMPLLFIAGLQAGIVEEIGFRGILYRYVEEGFGSWAAVAVSAAVFGVMHLWNPGATWNSSLAIAVEAGLLFAALYLLTRNLWLVIGLHFSWNVVQGLFWGVPVSGGDVVGLIKSAPAGPDIISGGSFGVEGSIVPVVLLGGLSVWLLVVAHRRGVIVAPFWVRRRRARELS